MARRDRLVLLSQGPGDSGFRWGKASGWIATASSLYENWLLTIDLSVEEESTKV